MLLDLIISHAVDSMWRTSAQLSDGEIECIHPMGAIEWLDESQLWTDNERPESFTSVTLEIAEDVEEKVKEAIISTLVRLGGDNSEQFTNAVREFVENSGDIDIYDVDIDGTDETLGMRMSSNACVAFEKFDTWLDDPANATEYARAVFYSAGGWGTAAETSVPEKWHKGIEALTGLECPEYCAYGHVFYGGSAAEHFVNSDYEKIR